MTPAPDTPQPQRVSIHDPHGTPILTLRDVSFQVAGNAFCGQVEQEQVNMPAELTALLADLDDRVSHLSLAYIDEIQDKIDAFNLTAHFQDGSSLPIKDLYLGSDGGSFFRKADRPPTPQHRPPPHDLGNPKT